MMQDRQRLILGSSTVLIGGLASVAIASGNPMLASAGGAIAGGTAGIVGGTIFTKRRERQFSDIQSPVNEQLVNLLGKLGDLQGETKTELAALKGKIDQTKGDLKSELKSLKDQIGQTKGDLKLELKGLKEQIDEDQSQSKTELTTLKNRLDRYRTNSDSSLQQLPPTTDTLAVASNNSEPNISLAIEKPSESESPAESVAESIDWFKGRNITVETYRQPESIDVLFDRIALFLGEQYSHLKALYKQIKFHLKDGSKFKFRLAEKSEAEISYCTNFCAMLHQSSLLSYYRYDSKIKEILISPQTNPKIVNFLEGDWFERFVYKKICDLLVSQNANYRAFRGIKGSFDTQRDFELDLLFLVDDRPLWIECKAGQDYNSYLNKYSEYRKKLGISKERSFLVVLDLPDIQTSNYTSLWSLTVANINNLIQQIDRALNPDKPEDRQVTSNLSSDRENIKNDRPVIWETSKLLAFLNRKCLRPLPEHRKAAIDLSIELFSSLDRPLTINQIKEALAERLPVSKQAISNIIKAIKLGGCFLNESGEIVSSYNFPVSRLVSLEPAILEQKCMESYAAAVLPVAPNYFENSDNVSTFEQTTGGKAPTPETIEVLKMKNTNVEEP
jgi:hypothetical protein